MDRRNVDSRSLTRRHALALMSAGAGAAFSADLRAQMTPAFPRGAIIRTLFKDVPPSAIDGPILFHEHLADPAEARATLPLALTPVHAALDQAISTLDTSKRD